MLPCRHLSVSIRRSPAEVAAFAGDPRNLPSWASGLGDSVQQEGGQWRVMTPQGECVLRFAPANSHGVLDHEVETPADVVKVPMRVVPNGEGSELIFTLYRQPGMTEAEFERDAALVLQDLTRLQHLLEAE